MAVRVSAAAVAELDRLAAASERTRSEVAREAMAIGTAQLAKRYPAR